MTAIELITKEDLKTFRAELLNDISALLNRARAKASNG